MHAVHLTYTRRPSMPLLYAKGLLERRSGSKAVADFPWMKSEWRGFKIDREHLRRFTNACRLPSSGVMPLVYPLVFAFPLHVSIVCHSQFPLLYIRMMQIRNHVIQHRSIDVEEPMDITCAIVGWRNVVKGFEMDIHTLLKAAGQTVWESIHTYFFPGTSGGIRQVSPLSTLPPLPDKSVERMWKMPAGGGLCFGLMTGDYNAIHYLAPYARRMGFQRDFAHAQLTIALCLQHMPAIGQDVPVFLDVAIKGPVYYGSNVTMKYFPDGSNCRFDLFCEDNRRPSISGCLSTVEPDVDSLYDYVLA